jgi:hypothetical protein
MIDLAKLCEPCQGCREARKAAEELMKLCRNSPMELHGYQYDDDDGSPKDFFLHGLTVRCQACKDSRLVLTQEGKQLVAFVGKFLGQSNPADLAQGDNIPF